MDVYGGAKCIGYYGRTEIIVAYCWPMWSIALVTVLMPSPLPVSYTHLDVYKRQLLERVGSIWDLFIGWYPGAMGETCTALLLIIGVILAIRKVIDWRVPLIYLMTVALMALVLGLCAGVGELWLSVALDVYKRQALRQARPADSLRRLIF